MANEKSGAAQNKMGELFVDIGSSGLGKLVKGLNSVSASFLLGKKAAEQFTKPIRGIMKEAGSDARSWSKLSVTMGTNIKQMQGLTRYFEARGLDSGLLSDIQNMQAKFYDITHGFAGVDEKMARAFNLMELNLDNYDGSLESILRLIEDIRKQSKKLNYSALDTQSRLREMELNPEWAYAFQRPDFNLSNALSAEEIDELNKSKEAFDELKVNIKQLKDKFGAKIAPTAITTANGINKMVTGEVASTTYNKKLLKQAAKDAAIGTIGGMGAGAVTGAAVLGALGAFFGLGLPAAALGAKLGTGIGAFVGSGAGIAHTIGGTNSTEKPTGQDEWSLLPKDDSKIEELKQPLKPLFIEDNEKDYTLTKEGLPTGGAASIDFGKLVLDSLGLDKVVHEDDSYPVDFIPDNIKTDNPMFAIPGSEQSQMLNSINVTTNITNNNNISSSDPQGVAQEIVQFNEQDISLAAQQAFYQAYPL